MSAIRGNDVDLSMPHVDESTPLVCIPLTTNRQHKSRNFAGTHAQAANEPKEAAESFPIMQYTVSGVTRCIIHVQP